LTPIRVKGIFLLWVLAACRFAVSRVVARSTGRVDELS
jgi:hypothetical protein